MNRAHSHCSATYLCEQLEDARARLKALCALLEPEQWIGPYLPSVNPPLWELGHIIWFQEHWCLRLKPGVDPAASPLLAPLHPARVRWADWLYNSSHIPHAARWQAPLPSARETMDYGEQVLAEVCDKIRSGRYGEDFFYYVELSLYHELMHTEAWWMMWQAHELTPPFVPVLPSFSSNDSLAFASGTVTLGSVRGDRFVFDNEKWAHEVAHDAFEIDAVAVTCGAFADFVADRGYTRSELWSEAGRQWRDASGALHPAYWRRTADGWQIRRFDRWIDLACTEPVMHVNRFEAEAYCAWRGRQLPSAAQWLRASEDARFNRARCWEWTRDMFAPYAGFSPDPYTDYSAPWFHTHAEVRGAGSWVTDPALARPTYRNFFTLERYDPFIGFRTALARG